jgi:hypothetical protein
MIRISEFSLHPADSFHLFLKFHLLHFYG